MRTCLIYFALFLSAAASFAQASDPLPRSTPEAQGVASAALSDFIAALDRDIEHVHGVMVLRGGHVIAEGWWQPYRPDQVHLLHSLSKSFTSTAVGLAVDEGLLSLDDTLVSFFPDLLPETPSPNLSQVRIRDLLSMSTGHVSKDLNTLSLRDEDSIVKAFLALPVAHKPGTHFLYNTPATYMCAAIVEKVTGEKLLDYLRPRLLDPLGIEQAYWSESAEGVTVGGWGLSVRTEAIAHFGQLYLQQGHWQGRQLISRDWVRAATSRQTSTGSNPASDWDQGYGYQFWRSRHASYRGDGAFGQFALVLPEHDAVVAINSGSFDMQRIMNIAWERLLPAFGPAPLAEDAPAHNRLQEQLARLAIPIPDSKGEALGRAQWLGRRWQIAENGLGVRSLSLAPEGDDSILSITTADATHQIRSSSARWISFESNLSLGAPLMGADRTPYRIAASEHWRDENTLLVRIAYTETPRMTGLLLRFSDQSLTIKIEHSASFGAGEVNELTGVMRAAPLPRPAAPHTENRPVPKPT